MSLKKSSMGKSYSMSIAMSTKNGDGRPGTDESATVLPTLLVLSSKRQADGLKVTPPRSLRSPGHISMWHGHKAGRYILDFFVDIRLIFV